MDSIKYFRFSLRRLLLVPLIAILLLAWINVQFRTNESTTWCGFAMTLNGLGGREKVHSALGDWLEKKGYRRCEAPGTGAHIVGSKEEWFRTGAVGERRHYVVIQSNDDRIQTNVHCKSTRWFYEPTHHKDIQACGVIDELEKWWRDNSSLLTVVASNKPFKME